MNPEDTKRITRTLAPLAAIFPNWNPKPEALNVYQAVLADLEPEMLEAAIFHLVTEPRDFMPTPGFIREAALELEDIAAEIPSAYEGWEQALKSFNSLSSERGHAHAFVNQAIRRIGGWERVGQSTNLTSERARFIDAYNELRSEDRKERRMLPQVRDHIDLLMMRKMGMVEPGNEDKVKSAIAGVFDDDLARLPAEQKSNVEAGEK